jgi:hypothetical protein
MAKKKKGDDETSWSTGENPKPVSEPEPEPEPPASLREKHGQEYARELPVVATLSDLAQLGQQLAATVDEVTTVKTFRRESNAQFREQLTSLEAQQKKLSECMKSGRKLEPVTCQEYMRKDNLIEVVRLDTGEIVETRQATSDDLQKEIDVAELHERRQHRKLRDQAGDGTCEECGGEDDVHEDGCSQVKKNDPDADTDPPPDGTDTADLAAETETAALSEP